MYCKNCGAMVDEDALFCEKCGNKIKQMNFLSGEMAEVILPDIDSSVAWQDAKGQDKAAKKKHPVVILFLAVFVAALIALAIVMPPKSVSNSNVYDPVAQCNFNNGAKVAYDDERLYFVDSFEEGGIKTCLYSTSYTGENKTLISDNSNISKIRIANNKILYQIDGEDTYSIGMMDKDGKNDFKIIELSRENENKTDYDDITVTLLDIGNFDASSSALYYIYKSNLRTCDMDGRNDSVIAGGVIGFVLVGETIYYRTDNSIFSYDINNAETREICAIEEGDGLYNNGVVFDNDKIYFSNGKGIYSVALAGNEPAQCIATDDEVENFIFYGEYIYYIQKYDTKELAYMISTVLDNADNESSMSSIAASVFRTGRIARVSAMGGEPEIMDSDQPLSFSLYAYPNGMYSQISAVLPRLFPINFTNHE